MNKENCALKLVDEIILTPLILCGKSEQVGHVTAGGEIQNSFRIVERLLRMGPVAKQKEMGIY